MKDDVAAMENGDRDGFKYADDFIYPAVKVDRVLRAGDSIRMGDVLLWRITQPVTLEERPRGRCAIDHSKTRASGAMEWRSRQVEADKFAPKAGRAYPVCLANRLP